MNFKELKIEVNEQQPLNEIVDELIKQKYKPFMIEKRKTKGWILTHNKSGVFSNYGDNINPDMKITTLDQLKAMGEK